MNYTLKAVKAYLKELALDIRKMKNSRKEYTFGHVPGLDEARHEYRHLHIAYCEFRGRERDQIESPKDDNLPNEALVQEYRDKITEAMEG